MKIADEPPAVSEADNAAAAASIKAEAEKTTGGEAEQSERDEFSTEFARLATPTVDDPPADMPWDNSDEKADKKEPAAAVKDDKPAREDKAVPEDQDGDEAWRTKFVIAKRALLRDGTFTEEDLRGMKPQSIIDKGERAAKRQRDIDAMVGDLKRAKSTGKPAGKDLPGDTAGRDTKAGRSGIEEVLDDDEESPRDDTSEAALIGELTNEYLIDEKDAKRLLEKIKKTVAPREDVVAKAEQAREEAVTRLAASQIGSARAKLAEQFPALKDDAKCQQVLRWIEKHDPDAKIAFSGDAELIQQHMEDAAYAVLGKELRMQERKSLLASNRKAIDGQPEKPGSPITTTRGTMSEEDKGRAEVAAHVRFQDDPIGLRRALAAIDG